QVNLLTEIVPVSESQTRVQANKESTTMADETNQTASEEVVDNAKDKTKMKDTGATPATPTDEPGKKQNESAAAAAPAANAASTATQEAPRVKTMSEYLSDMPEEMREVFQSGLKLHNQK